MNNGGRRLAMLLCALSMIPCVGPAGAETAPDEAATCLHAYPGGVAITMMEEVTEADYLGGAPAPR